MENVAIRNCLKGGAEITYNDNVKEWGDYNSSRRFKPVQVSQPCLSNATSWLFGLNYVKSGLFLVESVACPYKSS